MAAPQLRWHEELHVAVLDDELIGYCTHQHFTDPETIGEVMELYVHPAVARRGIGRRLLDNAVARLARHGCDDVVIRVLDGNIPSHRFYAACGFTRDIAYRQRRTDIAGVDGRPVGVIQFVRRRVERPATST